MWKPVTGKSLTKICENLLLASPELKYVETLLLVSPFLADPRIFNAMYLLDASMISKVSLSFKDFNLRISAPVDCYSIILGILLVVPWYGMLIYHWSDIKPRIDNQPRTLNETASMSKYAIYVWTMLASHTVDCVFREAIY